MVVAFFGYFRMLQLCLGNLFYLALFICCIIIFIALLHKLINYELKSVVVDRCTMVFKQSNTKMVRILYHIMIMFDIKMISLVIKISLMKIGISYPWCKMNSNFWWFKNIVTLNGIKETLISLKYNFYLKFSYCT